LRFQFAAQDSVSNQDQPSVWTGSGALRKCFDEQRVHFLAREAGHTNKEKIVLPEAFLCAATRPRDRRGLA